MNRMSSGGQIGASAGPRPHHLSAHPGVRTLLFVTLALSSVVLVEPAPYEFLVLLMLVTVFPLGLRFPRAASIGLALLGVFLAGNLIGAIFAGYTSSLVRSLSIRVYLMVGWVLFVSLIASDAPNVLRTIWSGYKLAALFAVAWGVSQFYGILPGEFSGPNFRTTGPFKDANVFAPFLVPVALLVVARLFSVRGTKLASSIVWFLIILLGIFLAFSRGAWINFLASFSLLSLFLVLDSPTKRQKLQFFLLQFVLVLSAAIALVWIANNTSAEKLFGERASLVQKYDVMDGGRFYLQRKAIHEIGTHPAGIGPGMTTLVLGKEPHNVYLHVAAESGWIGALGIYFFFLLTLTRGFSYLKTAKGESKTYTMVALSALIGIMLQSLFIDSTHWRHFWLLMAMIWGLTSASQNGSSEMRRD